MNNVLTVLSIVAKLIFADPVSYIGNEPNKELSPTNIENVVMQASEPLEQEGYPGQAQDLMDIFTEDSNKIQSYMSFSYMIPTSNFANNMDHLYDLLILAADVEQDHPKHFSGFKKAIDDLNVFYKGDLMNKHQDILNNGFVLSDAIESNYELMQHYQENGDVEAMSDFARKVNQDYLSFLESVNESVWGDLDALSGVVKFLRTQPKDPITYELMDLTVKLAENRIYLLNETRYLYHELSQSTFETCDNTYTMVNSN
ncbi:hypothetical protein HOC35_00400 [Candidatus Woesearchaeota archaeon]|jgi:hypothetical protein|nr:hypothetical protein [Candidatus Woesearchaeota archaeon]